MPSMKHIPLNKILAAHIIIFLLLQHLRSSDKGWKRSFWMGFYLVLYSIHVYIYIICMLDLSIKDPCHPALSQGRLLHNFEVAFATHGVARRHRLPFVAQLTPDTASMSKRAEKRNETWWDHQKALGMYVEWRFPKWRYP